MSNYRKGAKAEREVMDLLSGLGYYCIRSAGSKGLFDVVGIHLTHVRLIQVKSDDMPTRLEMEALKEFEAPLCSKELWVRTSGRPFEERWYVEIIK